MKTLDSICLNIVDCEHKTAPTQETGIPSIRTTDIKKGVIDFNGANKVSVDTYKKWTQRLEPQAFDLILAREAPVGEVGIIPQNQKVCLGQRTVLIRPNPEMVDPYYLLLLLLSREIQHEMKIRASGSTVEHLNMSDIRGLKLPKIPPLEEQKAIASVLSCLDDKIENLRRQNETLEAIAQTLFKHWFIDFEFPNDDGKPYKSSGGEMRSTELGDIPKDWQVGKLGDEFKILMGQSPAGSSYNENQEGFIFYQGRTDFGFRFPTVRLYTTEPKRIAEKFDVLVSVRAPVGDINVAFEKCCIGRGLSAVKSKYRSYCLYKLKSYRKTFDIFETEGTVFGSLNKDNFNNLVNIIPHSTTIIQFENITSSLDQKIFLNTRQIQTLTKARDELLLKLMSGQLRVKG